MHRAWADDTTLPPPRRIRSFRSKASVLQKYIYALTLISVFPVALTSFIWLEVWNGVASRAIDGSSHFAIAQIYDRLIFPDTFGWTHAYFGGMSFPNFYPPVFFWCVSLIHHTGLVPFATAFKLVVAIPLLGIPAVFWAIMWRHSGRDAHVAFAVAIACVTMITVGELFQPSTGLDVSSTLMDGFYTQPLGFLLLLLWTIAYLVPGPRRWHVALASVLLALTVLANFFNAITAILFIISTLTLDIVILQRRGGREQFRVWRRTFLFHLLSPCLALGLAAFWIVPMLSSYEEVVTRPIITPLRELLTLPLLCWYAFAGLGIVIWKRQRSDSLGPYLLTSLLILFGLLFSGIFAARWFPLQSFRFFSTLNLLLSIPVGIAASYLIKRLVPRGNSRPENKAGPSRMAVRRIVVVSISITAMTFLGLAMSTKKLTTAVAFYSSGSFQRISNVLHFADSHRNGRYLVEVLPSRNEGGLLRADSLALNAYLGAQGNETMSIAYREASPNSIFFNAQLNALSAYKENFGISSVLMDDLDFINQPLTQHFKRLQFIGVRFLVIATAEMKERLSREPEIGARYDYGEWSVLELKTPTVPSIRQLEYRPALVVSDFTLKLRRQNQFDFVRLAEEQFNDAWFDVLLVRSHENKTDKLQNLELFGALILDTYEFEDESRAYGLLKEFAQTRPLILLTSESSLLNRIRASLADFPRAVVIQRQPEAPGEWVESMAPSHNYNHSSIREIWSTIRRILDDEKIEVHPAEISGSTNPRKIDITIRGKAPDKGQPILISSTFHPKWVRNDNDRLYAVTPFFTLGFFDQSTQLAFERRWYDRLALWISLTAFLMLIVFAIVDLNGRRLGWFSRKQRVSKSKTTGSRRCVQVISRPESSQPRL